MLQMQQIQQARHQTRQPAAHQTVHQTAQIVADSIRTENCSMTGADINISSFFTFYEYNKIRKDSRGKNGR